MEPGRLPAGALAGTHLASARVRLSLTLTEMPLTFCQIWLNEATGGAGVVFRVFSPGFCTMFIQDGRHAGIESRCSIDKTFGYILQAAH